MRRALLVVALGIAGLAAGAGTADATNECRGLMACVPVAGPWVVVTPSQKIPRAEVQYQLACPKGYVVAGVDAELTDRAIDLWFLGASGSPVGPGTTTSRTIVFVATYVGTASRAPTFRPHIGCIPATGGGRRTPTAVQAVLPPGRPTIRRVRTIRVRADRAYSVSCRRDERLVAGYAARGFRTATPPTDAMISSFTIRPALAQSHVVVHAGGGRGRGLVQVAAVCAGGR